MWNTVNIDQTPLFPFHATQITNHLFKSIISANHDKGEGFTANAPFWSSIAYPKLKVLLKPSVYIFLWFQLLDLLESFFLLRQDKKKIEQKGIVFWPRHWLFILLFFFNLLLGGKRKGEKNNQSREQKTMPFCSIIVIENTWNFLFPKYFWE